jgi:hypothetical protein
VSHLPYIRDFAHLEWFVGKAAIAVDEEAGVQYLHLNWPVDDLLKIYLTDNAPDEFRLSPDDVWLEVRGARGEFQVNRLSMSSKADNNA